MATTKTKTTTTTTTAAAAETAATDAAATAAAAQVLLVRHEGATAAHVAACEPELFPFLVALLAAEPRAVRWRSAGYGSTHPFGPLVHSLVHSSGPLVHSHRFIRLVHSSVHSFVRPLTPHRL